MTENEITFIIGEDHTFTRHVLAQEIYRRVHVGSVLICALHVRLTLFAEDDAYHDDKSSENDCTIPALTREVGDCHTDAGDRWDDQKRDVPRAAIGIKVRQACATRNGKRQKQEYSQAARTRLIFHESPARKDCHSHKEQEAHHVPDSELPKEILEDSEGVSNQEKQRIVAGRIEIRMAKKELAHPSLQSRSRFSYSEL